MQSILDKVKKLSLVITISFVKFLISVISVSRGLSSCIG